MKKGATFAEVLKGANYRTIMTGKWHQRGITTDFGFDRYLGLADGCCNFWNPGIDAKTGEPKPGRKKQNVQSNRSRKWGIEGQVYENYVPTDPNFYTTDAFTNYAVERLEEYKDEDKPFLLYLAYTAPHFPLHAWPEDIAKYKDTYLEGWDVIRERRFKKIKQLGLIPADTPPTARNPRVPAWNSLSPAQQREEAHKMAVYAAMIDRMDQGIGRVFDKLKELNKFDDTLIIFLSDNGASSEGVDYDVTIPAGPVEGYRAMGPGWSHVSNLPYREYKATNHQGGTKTPCIVKWPGVTEKQTLISQTCHVMDFLPTFMDITQAPYPESVRQITPQKPQGMSLVPYLRDSHTPSTPRTLFWNFSAARAAMHEGWKLVRANKDGAEWELYHIAADPTEYHDLAKEHPEKIAQLSKMWEQWNKNPSLSIPTH